MFNHPQGWEIDKNLKSIHKVYNCSNCVMRENNPGHKILQVGISNLSSE